MKGKRESPPKGVPPAGGEEGGTPGRTPENAGEPAAAGPAPAAGGTATEEGAAATAGAAAEVQRLRAREDELLRALAELTNVQRRRRQEMEQALAFAHEPLVRALLPVLDDLERALAATEGREEEPLAAGVRLVLDQLRATLERDGLEAIRPVNGGFDPELHDALMQRPEPGIPPHTVLEVVKPGYRYRGRVLRHAQVVVSEDPAPRADAPPAAGAASIPEADASKAAKEGRS